jgi:hypothetical protein
MEATTAGTAPAEEPHKKPRPRSPRDERLDQAALDQAALDRTAALCQEVVELVGRASRISQNPEVKALMDLAVRNAREAINTLNGKRDAKSPLLEPQPNVEEPEKKPDKLALSSLAPLDTPAARRLLALLEETLEAAEQVDFERGRALTEDIPLLPGESRGTDLAESISEIALRVRVEVNGPKGRE